MIGQLIRRICGYKRFIFPLGVNRRLVVYAKNERRACELKNMYLDAKGVKTA